MKAVFPLPIPAKGTLKISGKSEVATGIFERGQGQSEDSKFKMFMNITSRYSDIPEVMIDESKIPVEVRPLLPLAREWSISDDVELEAYIAASSEVSRRQFFDAFRPHFNALARWNQELAHLVPQPDELVLFDIAANAAATVGSTL